MALYLSLRVPYPKHHWCTTYVCVLFVVAWQVGGEVHAALAALTRRASVSKRFQGSTVGTYICVYIRKARYTLTVGAVVLINAR